MFLHFIFVLTFFPHTPVKELYTTLSKLVRMEDTYVAYLLLSIWQVFCYAYSIHRVYYYKRKQYRSDSVDVVAGTIYFLFSVYYNAEFWAYDIMSCKTAHSFAVAGVSLVGPAFFMQICDLLYARFIHSIDNFVKIRELNYFTSFYKQVHNSYKYAVLFFVCNAGFLLAVLTPPEYPSYDGPWINSEECLSHSRTYSVIVPKYVFILGNLFLALALYRWKEGQEFRLYMIFSMISIGTATVIWSMMFEFISEQASTLPYIWVCCTWIFLLTKYGNIVSREEEQAVRLIAANNYLSDVPTDLSGVFRDPYYLELWKAFVAKEFSTENTLCYLELQRLPLDDSDAHKPFVDTYIRSDSTHQVNIPDSMKRKIEESDVMTKVLADSLKQELFALMSRDTFNRFVPYARIELTRRPRAPVAP